jgi:putative ABC transport system permease protein
MDIFSAQFFYSRVSSSKPAMRGSCSKPEVGSHLTSAASPAFQGITGPAETSLHLAAGGAGQVQALDRNIFVYPKIVPVAQGSRDARLEFLPILGSDAAPDSPSENQSPDSIPNQPKGPPRSQGVSRSGPTFAKPPLADYHKLATLLLRNRLDANSMERLLQDVGFGIRSLLKSPRFTIATLLTLALGIGANTAMFSVIHSVLLKSWPVHDSSRLMVVWQRQANGNSNLFSTQDFLDWKRQSGRLAPMAAHVSWEFNLSGVGTQPERVAGGEVSSGWLPSLGVEPMLGRYFSTQEDVGGAGNFVVLSSALWNGRYGANPDIVGQSIQLDGSPYTVVGVMPAGFNGLNGKELLWTPLQLHPGSGPGASPNVHWLSGLIRLPDGVSLRQARNQLDALAARLHQQDPSGDMGFGVYLQTLNDAFTRDVRPAMLMLMGCVGFVLLIACANVANLLLARGAIRQREMAVRTALGASPLRIVRQLLTESVLLAGGGGTMGIAIAFVLLRGVVAIHTPVVPGIEQAGIDGPVLAYSLLVSVVVGVLFGLAPAIEATGVDVNDGLRDRGSSTSRGLGRHRSVLVVTETALACMLLIGTGLALKSLWSLKSMKLGFVPENVLTFRVAAPSQLSGARMSDFYHDVAERVRAIPGVESAAIARDFPLSATDPSLPIDTEGKTPVPAQGEIVTRYRAIGEDYFHTMEIPVLQGRTFDQRDTVGSSPVAVVSESLARKYWPGESAVGKRIKPKFTGSSWCVVVGVVADLRHWGADVVAEPTAYYPYTQVPDSMRSLVEANMGIAVRSHLIQRDLLHSITASVANVNSQVAVYETKTMESMVADSDSLRNFDLLLLAGFSFLALALAAVGVYAVMAYSVSQRTREIGVRIALGAGSRDVLRLVLRQGARLAIAGSVIGVAGAFFLRKIMASFLYGLSANDPFILCLVPCIMLLVIVFACWLPARRATKVDPMVALGYE